MLDRCDAYAHYGTNQVVQSIHLAAMTGEVVGMFGRNGIGKTTLIKTSASWIKSSAICEFAPSAW